MARLDIEVVGDNKGFKSTVKDTMSALEDLKKFSEGIKIEMFGGQSGSDLKQMEANLSSISKVMKTFETDAKKGANAINSNLKTAITELKVSEQGLKNEYQKNRVELSQYSLEQRKLADAQRAETATANQAKQAQRDLLSERRRGEAEARKLAAIIAKNRKQVEKESSEYYKLSTALGALRKSSKDVLAEMFRLESQGQKGSVAYQKLADKARVLTAQTNHFDAGIKKIDSSLGLHQRNVGNYSSALSALSPQFSALSSQLQMMGVDLDALGKGGANAFTQLGTSIVNVGKNVGAFLLSPLGLAITAIAALISVFRSAAPTVKEFNAGLLNVSKTTGIAGLELEGLSDAIIDLSRKLQVVSTKKLLEYATVAGQLGVKGSKNIMDFAESLAMLETASDITGEAGGAEIARMLTLTDGGVQNIKAFGDEIVNLGNNFAATEREILANAEGIAQNTGQYKFGRQNVLAYAAATKSVGLEADITGSAIFRTLAQLDSFSRGAKGSEKALKLLGLSQSELNSQFKESSANVLTKFISSLKDVDSAGGSVTDTLESLGLKNIRDIRVIGTLATNYGHLQQALTDVGDASGAMEREFATKAGSLVNQTGRIGIAWDNLVLSIENGSGAIGRATVFIVDLFASALEGATNVVTSKSWGEFWDRVNPMNWGKGQNVTDIIDFKKILKDTQHFNMKFRQLQRYTMNGEKTFEANLEAKGATEFTKELEKAKSTYDNILDARTRYEAAVKSGRLKESEFSISQYKIEESKAEAHYLEMQRLRNKFGFNKTEATTSGTKTEEETEKELKAREAAQKRIENIVADSNARVLTAGTEKREKELKQIEAYYSKRLSEVSKGSSAEKTLINNKRIEEDAINLKWDNKELEDRKKHEDEINKILESSVIEKTKTRQQELALNELKYKNLLKMEKNTQEQILRLKEAEKNEAANINAKHDELDFQQTVKFLDRLNRNREKALTDQLDKETRIKIANAKGDSDLLLAIDNEYFTKRQEISDEIAQMTIASNNDNSPLYFELAQAELELSNLKKKFETGLMSAEAFESDRSKLQDYISDLRLVQSAAKSIESALASSFTAMIMDGQDAAKTIKNAFRSMASAIISEIARIAAAKLVANIFSGGLFGGVSKLLGFADGGYTGNVGVNKVAGVVHGQEYVFDAATTKKYRGLFDSIKSGTFTGVQGATKNITSKSIPNVGSGGGVQVFIPETRIEGSDIVVAYKRASKEIDRYT